MYKTWVLLVCLFGSRPLGVDQLGHYLLDHWEESTAVHNTTFIFGNWVYFRWDRDRERREDGRGETEKERQDKRRQEKTREERREKIKDKRRDKRED